MRYAYGVTAALLLGGATTMLATEPLGAQDVANARYDPGRWAGGFPGSFAPLPRRLRAAPDMDPNQIACARIQGNRVCRTRGEWAELEMRRTVKRTK